MSADHPEIIPRRQVFLEIAKARPAAVVAGDAPLGLALADKLVAALGRIVQIHKYPALQVPGNDIVVLIPPKFDHAEFGSFPGNAVARSRIAQQRAVAIARIGAVPHLVLTALVADHARPAHTRLLPRHFRLQSGRFRTQRRVEHKFKTALVGHQRVVAEQLLLCRVHSFLRNPVDAHPDIFHFMRLQV